MDLQSARPFTTGDPLSIPEILQRIFQAADRSSLRASACVCQRWSAIALDQLWRSLSSILHLLALLAPRTLISTAGSDPNALIKALVEANWVRFRDYARRVRRISCPKVKEDELSLNCVALIQVFHGASAILPNVKEISWTFWDPKNCLAIIPFLGPRLETLFLGTRRISSSPEQVQLFRSLVGHVSNLQSLEIGSPRPIRRPKVLASLIESCPNLRVLDLPPYYLTKEVVAAAARLAHLEALYCDVSPGTEIAYTESGMEFKFTANSFPQLTDVAFAAFAVRMAQVFQVPERIANLNLVDLNCPLGGSAEEIKTIFANLATGAPVLQVIRLVCTSLRRFSATSVLEPLSVNAISPLFSCRCLTSFTLLGSWFQPFTAEEVTQMGKSWPRISYVIICPVPLVDHCSGTDINILSAFAQSFPLLRELDLFFQAEISGFDGNISPPHTFGNLEQLGVGMSPCPKKSVQDVGLLIASLCTRLPSLVVGNHDDYQCYRGEADRPNDPLPKDFTDGWKQVQMAMEVAFRTKTYMAR